MVVVPVVLILPRSVWNRAFRGSDLPSLDGDPAWVLHREWLESWRNAPVEALEMWSKTPTKGRDRSTSTWVLPNRAANWEKWRVGTGIAVARVAAA